MDPLDALTGYMDQARTLAIAQRRLRELQLQARQNELELKILRHISGRPWWWHLGCAATTVVERAVEAARRRLDGPDVTS